MMNDESISEPENRLTRDQIKNNASIYSAGPFDTITIAGRSSRSRSL